MPNSDYLLTAGNDGAIYRIDTKYAATNYLFSAPLVHPFGLTLSPDGKKIYISDRGRTENVVKVFSYPDGKPLGFVGKPGGPSGYRQI